jgi:3'-phosphoadenosine 5'-phosphosulfate sulfotransferase (PAPS reductase)/FAD synthetase
MRAWQARHYQPSPDWRRDGLAWAATAAFAQRVDRSRAILREAARHGAVMVATSWGKDSTVTADLALDVLGPVPLVHLASTYELPGYDEVIAHFAARTEVVTLAPTRTLAETVAWLHANGLCYERGQYAAAKRGKADRMAEWCAARGYRVQVLGLRGEESAGRRVTIRAHGLVRTRRDGYVTAIPIAHWTARDVWAYIAVRALPYNRLIYDAETHGFSRYTLRNTGWLTTVGAEDGRLVWLRTHHPALWQQLALEFPRVRAVS